MCCTLMSSHVNDPSIICQGTTRIFDNNSIPQGPVLCPTILSHDASIITTMDSQSSDHVDKPSSIFGGVNTTSSEQHTNCKHPADDHGGTSHTSTGIAIPTSNNDHGGASHTSTGIELLTMPTSHFHCLFGLSGEEQEGDTEMSTIFSTDSE